MTERADTQRPASESPRLLFSRRRMLNRLSYESQTIDQLRDLSTDQSHDAAEQCLRHLEEMGLADEYPDGWRVSDEGIAAAMANGVIYSNGVGK